MELSLLLVLVASFSLIFYFFGARNRKKGQQTDLQILPTVSASIPIIGHVLPILLSNPDSFMLQCYKKYGPAFKLKLMRFTFGVFCEEEEIQEIIRSREADLSFYGPLDDVIVYFSEGLVGKDRALLFRKCLLFRNEEIVEVIAPMIKDLMADFKKRCSAERINLTSEFHLIVLKGFVKLSLGFEFSEEMIHEYEAFHDVYHKAMFFARGIPTTWLKYVFNYWTTKQRPKIWAAVSMETKKYRKDPNYKRSPVLRAAVNAKNSVSGDPLNDHEICLMLLEMILTGIHNTSAGLLQTILELARSPQHKTLVREEIEECGQDDARIARSDYLTSCTIEAMRMNCNFVIIERYPISKKQVGKYFVGDVDIVVLAGHLYQVDGAGEARFPNGRKFNPNRYMEKRVEDNGILTSADNPGRYVIAWGGGPHVCRGRTFSILFTNLIIANFFSKFEINLQESIIKPDGGVTMTAIKSSHVSAKLVSIK